MSKDFKLNGIYSKGYGTIAKSVMQDRNISIKAKGLYAYLCSFSGKCGSCYPSRSKICYDLNINNNTLSKYIKELVNSGYISTNKKRNDNGMWCETIYKIENKNTFTFKKEEINTFNTININKIIQIRDPAKL